MANTLRAPHIPERTQTIEPSAAQAPLGLDLPISNEGETVSSAIFVAIQQLSHELNQLRQEVKDLRESSGEVKDLRESFRELCVFPTLGLHGIRTHRLNSQQLLPMKLHNSSVNRFTPLRYPPGVPTNTLPGTGNGLYYLTGKCPAILDECKHC